MINDTGKLTNPKTYYGNGVIYVGNGKGLPISHVGDANISISHE